VRVSTATNSALPIEFAASGSTITVTSPGGWPPDTNFTATLTRVADALGYWTDSMLEFRTGTFRAAIGNHSPEWNGALDAIVFNSDRFGSQDIFRIDSDGSNLQALTTLPGDEWGPTVSADGQLLAWQAHDGDFNSDIYVAPFDDPDSAVAITPADADERMPRFARTDSRSIVFVSDRLGGSQVFRMSADGSGYAALSPTFGSEQRSPAPHPLVDNQLLFSSDRGGSQDIWSMSVSAIDGSVTALNQTDTLSFDEISPDWGADASFFVYVGNEAGRPGRNDLWVGDLTGGRRRATFFETDVSKPSTSPVPGSTRCAASLGRSDGGSDIVIIDLVSGLVVRNLTSPEAAD
jgi:Tol biopolymer transport system component